MSEPNREEIMQAAAGGNASALEFLRAFARRAHWIDDLCDEDKLDEGSWYEAGAFAEHEAEWLLCLTVNPFFLAHKAQLVPAMVIALNAWVDSNQWTEPKDGPEQIRHRAQISVIKGQYHEVAWLVAWLTGGWSKLREVTSKYRSYDFEPSTCKRCKAVIPSEEQVYTCNDGETVCQTCWNDPTGIAGSGNFHRGEYAGKESNGLLR